MQLRPEVALRAMIKSLRDVVLPAVDPDNKLALEQLQVSIGLLSLMEQRLPLSFRFDCDELRRLLDFAAELAQVAGAGGLATDDLRDLHAAAASGAAVLARAQADPAEVLAAVRALRAAGSNLVTVAYPALAGADRVALERCVLTMSEAQLLRDRAWVLPQGWEPHPDSLPAISELLDHKVPGGDT